LSELGEKMSKVLVIGLDGATWKALDPMIQRGILPNIEHLKENGSTGILQSTYPPITPVAWTSFMTGTNPGQHGIYGYGINNISSMDFEPVSRLAIKKNTLWKLLSEHNQKSVVINVPMTFPPEPINGYLITGMMTPSTEHNYTYPKSLRNELQSRNINYRIDTVINRNSEDFSDSPFIRQYFSNGAADFFADLYNLTEARYKAVEYLWEKQWDFFMSVFVSMDRIQHYLWDYISPDAHQNKQNEQITRKIYEYYEYLDSIVGKIVNKVDANTTICLISDHGFGKFLGDLYINKWLLNQALYAVKTKRFLKYLKQLVTTIRIDDYIKKGINKRTNKEVFSGLKTAFLNNIDWTKTKAYMGSANGININLKGREKYGVVEPGPEYERIRETIIDSLLQLKTPQDEYAIETVFKKEDIYTDDVFDAAPDLIVIPSDNAFYGIYKRADNVDSMFEKSLWKQGDHRMDGIVLFAGNNIKTNYEISDSNICDIMPTILCALGKPIPNYVDGKVLQEIFQKKPDYITYTKEYNNTQHLNFDSSTKDKELVKERLKSLGYID